MLQTGQEIMELDHSGFSTKAPTIAAGNLGNDRYVIQVSAGGVRLMEGVKQVTAETRFTNAFKLTI